MSHTVSFIVPVRDRQHDLSNRVHRILEVLSELTSTFDVLIVTYGSSDETDEVAADLAREFPQVHSLERADLVEVIAAIEAGIQATRGDLIFIHDMSSAFSPTAVRQLWQIRDDDELVMAQSRATDGQEGSRPTRGQRGSVKDTQGTVQMLRRCAISGLQPSSAPSTAPWSVDRVTRTDVLQPNPAPEGLPRLLSRLRQLAARSSS